MGCNSSKSKKLSTVVPQKSGYVLRIAGYTNYEGKSASAAILYYEYNPISYDSIRHDIPNYAGIFAYMIGLELACETTAVDLRVQTHNLEILDLPDDKPEEYHEQLRDLESKFQHIRREFLFSNHNQEAIELCKDAISNRQSRKNTAT